MNLTSVALQRKAEREPETAVVTRGPEADDYAISNPPEEAKQLGTEAAASPVGAGFFMALL